MLCLAASPAICCPFLPPFQFYSICAVIHFKGCTRVGLPVWPGPVCGQFTCCIYQCPWVITQALTKAVQWEKVTLKIVRTAWTDVGSVVEFLLVSGDGFPPTNSDQSMQFSLLFRGSEGALQPLWIRLGPLLCHDCQLCQMLCSGFMVWIPLTTRDWGETTKLVTFIAISKLNSGFEVKA